MYGGLSVDEVGLAYVKVSGKCIITGEKISLSLSKKGWDKYIKGGYVQDCFPELSADDREFLISGISPGKFEDFIREEDDG